MVLKQKSILVQFEWEMYLEELSPSFPYSNVHWAPAMPWALRWAQEIEQGSDLKKTKQSSEVGIDEKSTS